MYFAFIRLDVPLIVVALPALRLGISFRYAEQGEYTAGLSFRFEFQIGFLTLL